MGKKSENSIETAKRVIGKPFKKGEPSPNPEGRPNGQKNYATLYKEALIKLGQLNNKTPDELELELISSGFTNARKGDYRFYKDVLDRLHGTATNKTDITSGGEKITTFNEEQARAIAERISRRNEQADSNPS